MPDTLTVVLVDVMDFRRSCIAEFLKDWASDEAVELLALPPKKAHDLLRQSMKGMVVFNTEVSCSWPDTLAEINALTTLAPAAPLIVLADSEDPSDVMSAVHAGAQGYVSNLLAPDLVLRTLSFVLHGGAYFPKSVLDRKPAEGHDPTGREESGRLLDFGVSMLAAIPEFSERQKVILEGLCLGEANKSIGRRLSLPETTVKVHVREIMRKLGVGNRTQVAVAISAMRQGYTKEIKLGHRAQAIPFRMPVAPTPLIMTRLPLKSN